MPRTLLGLAAVVAFALPCVAEQTDSNSEMLIRLNLTAGAGSHAGAPIPAIARAQGDESRQSDPELHEVHDGAEEILLRRRGFQSREKLLTMPLKELPAQDLKEYGRFCAESGRPGGSARQSRLAGSAKAEGRRDRAAASRGPADPRAGQGPSGAVSGRDRPMPLRRRDPNRQDDVRHRAPFGRAPDLNWRPGGDRDRFD